MDSRTLVRPMMPAAAALLLLASTACGGSDAGKAPAAAPASGAPAASTGSSTPAAPLPAPPGESPAPQARQSADAANDSPVPPGVDPKKSVATVNGKSIQAEKVYSVYQMNKMMLLQRGRTLNPTEDQMLKAQSMEVVIADELIYQAAQAAGVKASPAEVDASLKQWKSRVGSEENYKKFLEGSGMTPADVRYELERNLITEAYRKSLVAGQGVSDEQAKQFYDANKDMFKVPEQAHVQSILVKCSATEPESVRTDARKRAEEAHERAAAGEDFGALAKQFSQDPTAARGGDLGFFPRGVMFPKFDEAAFSLKPGGVSAVFETPTGFNVVKLIDIKPPSVRGFDEVKTELKLEMGRLLEQNVEQAKIQALSADAKIVLLDPAFAMPAPPQTASSAAPASNGPPAKVPPKP